MFEPPKIRLADCIAAISLPGSVVQATRSATIQPSLARRARHTVVGAVYSGPMSATPTGTDPAPGSTLTVTSLGSGSSGNALLVRTSDATLLVDCGVGIRGMTRQFAAEGLDISQVDAILLSHEHVDHVRELPRFKARDTAIYSTRGTAIATRTPLDRWQAVNSHTPRTIAASEVLAIPVSHDAKEPCGFLIRTRSGTVTVLTDLGCPSGPAVEAIAESDLVVVEANHDEAMLRRGPYPHHLQRRILSDAGHLSNVDCAELLANSLRGARRLPTIWLAHMSETNNRPHLAVKTVAQRLARNGLSPEILALPRREASRTWRPEDQRQSRVQLMFEFE